MVAPPGAPPAPGARARRIAAGLAAAALLAPVLGASAGAGEASFSLSWSSSGSPAAAEVQAVGGAGGVLVASPAAGPALRSVDGGQHWERIEGFPPVTKGRVAFDPTDPARGYVAGFGGVARTEDGGLTWRLVLAVARAARIDVSPQGLVLVGARHADTSNHLLLSRDRGATWQDLGAPFPAGPPICGVAFGLGADNLLIQTDDQSWFTADGGATWTETPGAGFDFGIEDAGVVWRAAVGALERSGDGGRTWEPLAVPGFGTAIGPRPGGGVVLASTAGLLESADGAAWANRGFAAAMAGATGVFADPGDAGAVWVTDVRLGIARVAPDGAGGFRYEGRTQGLPLAEVHALGGAPGAALAAGPQGLFASAGGPFQHTGAGLRMAPAAVAAAPDGRAYVGGRGLAGEPAVEAALPSREPVRTEFEGRGAVVGLAVASPTEAFAAVRSDGPDAAVYRTTDGGATWAPLLALPAAPPLHALAWHAPEGALLLATGAGLLAWKDGLWTLRGAGLNVSGVASDGARVYASGPGGVWRSPGAAALPLPWAAEGPPVAGLAAADRAAWAVGADGALLRCAGEPLGACAAEAPPAGPVRAVHATPGRILAAAEAPGVWWAATAAT